MRFRTYVVWLRAYVDIAPAQCMATVVLPSAADILDPLPPVDPSFGGDSAMSCLIFYLQGVTSSTICWTRREVARLSWEARLHAKRKRFQD